jgi:3',5'-cyclic AMP phosphodiesterase CpdA
VALSVLHLTDIHAGPGAVEDIDLKDFIPEADRQTMLDRLSDYLRALPTPPDYVVVSGDTANKGDPTGMTLFRSWLIGRIKEKTLPDASRILIVPGNHDVKWGVPERVGWHRERYEAFAKAFVYAFPHAHIPEHDPDLNAGKVKLNGKPQLGGMKAVAKHGDLRLVWSEPFILDLDKDLLLFGFNSTLGCGVYLREDPAVSQPLATLRDLHKGTPSAALLQQIEEKYTNSRLVDAGLIGKPQLDYFGNLMKRLKKELGETRFANLTKIAVLHHHVAHLWRQQLELKRFEAVVDAAQLKQALIAYGFHFVLHGHKHMNHVALDGTVIGVGEGRTRTPLCIVSGGTISGYPRIGDKQTFKVLNFSEERGPRRAMTIVEVPLLQDAAPETVLREEAQHYQVTLASAVAELHDFNRLKEQLDEVVVRSKCAAELQDAESIAWGDDATLPPTDPELVGPQTRYQLNRIVQTKDRTLFLDVILATSRLRFQQRARVYWLLRDVKHLSQEEARPSKVLLLIGNLENTPLAQTTVPEEVGTSIANLREWFAPAISAGWLEVRIYQFTEEEVAAIIGTKSRTE